jgi:hypothetical protein
VKVKDLLVIETGLGMGWPNVTRTLGGFRARVMKVEPAAKLDFGKEPGSLPPRPPRTRSGRRTWWAEQRQGERDAQLQDRGPAVSGLGTVKACAHEIAVVWRLAEAVAVIFRSGDGLASIYKHDYTDEC